MTENCDCCEGIGSVAPKLPENPPGQFELSTRVGTHASFLSAMLARLSELEGASQSGSVDAAAGCLAESHRVGIPGSSSDGARALLDAWACVGDVLTFYQERIANEGYLRTATEERSVRELGRLLGYEPRPGVAAGVDLAFTVVNQDFDGTVPVGTKLQSLPRPGKDAQTFETAEALAAKEQWNAMRPVRRSSGLFIRRELMLKDFEEGSKLVFSRRIEIFIKGVGQRVREGDVLLVLTGRAKRTPQASDLYRVVLTRADVALDQTTLRLVPFDGKYELGFWEDSEPDFTTFRSSNVLKRRRKKTRDILATNTISGGGTGARRDDLKALQCIETPEPPKVYVFRSVTQPFGHNAPKDTTVRQEPEIIANPDNSALVRSGVVESRISEEDQKIRGEEEWEKKSSIVFLDGEFPTLKKSDPVVAAYTKGKTRVLTVDSASIQARSAYRLNGKATRLELNDTWWSDESPPTKKITPLRETLFYVNAEPLTLLREPLLTPVNGDHVDLEGAVEGLPEGRWIIVEGELEEPNIPGFRVAERVRVLGSSIETTESESPESPEAEEPEQGDETNGENGVNGQGGVAKKSTAVPHTRLYFSPALRNVYKRDTVTLYGNVVHATHGETREQVLGSGNASQAHQRFELQQGPRTWVSAPTPSGVQSTLEVRVNGVLWREIDSFLRVGARDEVVVVRSKPTGKEEVIGGDGHRGARFMTGIENIQAKYRVGIGRGGNVDAGTVTTLITRPLGVSGVKNPLPASGGADPDDRDAMRQRIPIVARGGEDRILSARDYAEFALNFAGIEKAVAVRSTDAAHGQPTVRVVVAGAEPETLDPGSDSFRHLELALRRNGDPLVRVELKAAVARQLQLRARLRIDERYEMADVVHRVREALHTALGWSARGIGEAIARSEVIAVMQNVDGVRAVDVEELHLPATSETPPSPWRLSAAADTVLYFAADREDAIVLEELTQ